MQVSKAPRQASAMRRSRSAVRRPRTTLIGLAVLAIGASLFVGWSSLATLGATTFIVSLLPCLAMCALGVCAARMGTNDAASAPAATSDQQIERRSP